MTQYIERPVWNTDKLSLDELATLRFLRREAIMSLAAAGTPAVFAFTKPPVKDTPKDAGHVAPTLMKVLIKGAIQPDPTIQEKVEAALGLCAMEYANMPEYQPEVAVYLVGLTVIDFARAYGQDYPNFSIEKGKKAPFVAWKTDAKRLQAGLVQLKDNARGIAMALYLQKEAKQHVLDKMEKYSVVEPGRIQDLANYLAQPKVRPKDGKVFKTLSTPALTLP